MSMLSFGYPFMVFHKCSCTNQVPVLQMEMEKASEAVKLSYDLQCKVCGKKINNVINVDDHETEVTSFLNVFKVIPSIKEDLAVIKLDNVMLGLKGGEIKFYGKYTHLRFWDNKIETDKIPVRYEVK